MIGIVPIVASALAGLITLMVLSRHKNDPHLPNKSFRKRYLLLNCHHAILARQIRNIKTHGITGHQKNLFKNSGKSKLEMPTLQADLAAQGNHPPTEHDQLDLVERVRQNAVIDIHGDGDTLRLSVTTGKVGMKASLMDRKLMRESDQNHVLFIATNASRNAISNSPLGVKKNTGLDPDVDYVASSSSEIPQMVLINNFTAVVATDHNINSTTPMLNDQTISIASTIDVMSLFMSFFPTRLNAAFGELLGVYYRSVSSCLPSSKVIESYTRQTLSKFERWIPLSTLFDLWVSSESDTDHQTLLSSWTAFIASAHRIAVKIQISQREATILTSSGVSPQVNCYELWLIRFFWCCLGLFGSFLLDRLRISIEGWSSMRAEQRLQSLESSAIAMLSAGHFEQALMLLQSALPLVSRTRGESHIDTSRFRHLLAKVRLSD